MAARWPIGPLTEKHEEPKPEPIEADLEIGVFGGRFRWPYLEAPGEELYIVEACIAARMLLSEHGF